MKSISRSDRKLLFDVVGVAQAVEHQVVALVVAGSNPVTHPTILYSKAIAFVMALNLVRP